MAGTPPPPPPPGSQPAAPEPAPPPAPPGPPTTASPAGTTGWAAAPTSPVSPTSPGQPPTKRPIWKSPKAWAIGIGVLLLLGVIGAIASPRGGTPGDTALTSPTPTAQVTGSAPPTAVEPTEAPTEAATESPTEAATDAPTEAPTEAPTPTPEPPEFHTPAPPEFATIEDGNWVVGTDIRPGTYRLRETVDFCYWARLKGFSGDLDDIIANDTVTGWGVVTIGSKDKGFETTDCGTWSKDLSRVTASRTVIEEGTLIVGTDIAPGTYRSAAGNDSCYWARLRNFGGTLDGIIANGLTSSRAVVTIRGSDKGFKSSGCGEWKRV